MHPEQVDVTPQLEGIVAKCKESTEHHTRLGVLRAQVSADIKQAIAILQHTETLNRDKAEPANACATNTNYVRLLAEKALGLPPPPDPPSQHELKLPPTLPSFFFFTCVAVACLAAGGGPGATRQETPMADASARATMIGTAKALMVTQSVERKRRLTDAEAILSRLADEGGVTDDIASDLLFCRYELGDRVGVLAACNAARQNCPSAHTFRGKLLLDDGKHKEARTHFEQAIQLGDSDAVFLLRRCK